MKYRISHPTKKLSGCVELTASKSISNRALIIQALCSENFEINNLAEANDTRILKNILAAVKHSKTEKVYNVEDAGTAMRFLTAYCSTQPGTHILLCADRMKERPIGILVDALHSLGADIEYMEKEGFPPLKITGKSLQGTEVQMDGNVSSQFISALLLIVPELPNGLVIKFTGEVTSVPYINMTLKMLEEFRVYGQWHNQHISVSHQQYHKKSEPAYQFNVEADWSSASYWYAIAALAKEVDFSIKGFKHPSIQGDAVVADIFTFFDVKTEFIPEEGYIKLSKTKSSIERFGFDFSDCPDLAQTTAVIAGIKGITAVLNGLRTLHIKETDRVAALKNELLKIGIEVKINSEDSIEIKPSGLFQSIDSEISISTYKDHRMAMAFAALAMHYNSILIESPEVVKKSYPGFWDDLKKVGFIIEELND